MKNDIPERGVDRVSSSAALLLIDVQKGMFNKKIPAYKGREVLDNINALIEKAHVAGAPVFVIQHAGESVFAEGSEDWELHPDMRYGSEDVVIPKHKPDSFLGTSLEDQLKSKGITRVVAAGFVTHGCVKATCLGAVNRWYQVTLAHDAHSSYSKDAAKLIEEVGAKLTEAGVELKLTREVAF